MQKVLIIDHMVIKFTPREYQILACFLNGNVIADTHVIQEVFNCEDDPTLRHSLDKHVDKIRGKLRPFGLDIYRVMRYGYVLLVAIE